jgi:preprotein translocase subunit SecD
MKSRSAIKLGALLIVLIVIAYIGVFGIPVGVYDVLPYGEQAYKAGDVSEGTWIQLQSYNYAQEEETFNEDMDETIKILRERLKRFEFGDATVYRQGNAGIIVNLPVGSASADAEFQESYLSAVSSLLTYTGLVELKDPDNNLVFDNSNIIDAKMFPTSDSSFVLRVWLDEAGTAKLKEATANYAGKDFVGRRDNIPLSTDTVSNTIEDGIYDFKTISSVETAAITLIQIQEGIIPVDIYMKDSLEISASLGAGMLTSLHTAILIGVALVAVVLTVKYRMQGFVAAFTAAVYLLLLMLVTALVDYEISMASVAAYITGLICCLAANIYCCVRVTRELNAKGLFASSFKSGYHSSLGVVTDVHVVLVVVAFVMLCFQHEYLRVFGVGLLIASLLSFAVTALLPRFILKQIINLNIKKPGIYKVKEAKQ